MNGTMTTESSFVKSRAKLFAYRSEEEVVVDRKSNKTPSYVSLSCAVSGYSGKLWKYHFLKLERLINLLCADRTQIWFQTKGYQ